MAKVRRIAGLAVTGVLVAGIAGASAPASAIDTAPVVDKPEVYLGQSAGTALRVTALGNPLTFGVSNAKIDSTLKAAADGAGSLSALAKNTSAVTEIGKADPASGERCTTPALPTQLASTLKVGLACTRSSTALVDGVPKATSLGYVTGIDASAANALTALPVNLDLQPVRTALEGVLGTIPNDAVADTVGQLLDSVIDTQTLAVKLGPSTSDVSGTAAGIVSTSTAEAGRIDILPTGALDGGPLASIIIGTAKATATYDRAGGVATPTIDPALVTVKIAATPLTPAIEQTIKPGVTSCFLDTEIPGLGAPLKSCITVASGTTETTTDANGNKIAKAVADGVKLELLTGLQGGVVLELAHAEALAGGAPAIVAPPVETPRAIAPPTPTELPRTGGIPFLPMAGSGLLALAAVVRRMVGRVR